MDIDLDLCPSKRPLIMKKIKEERGKNFISEMKRDGTFNDTAFDREYESKWAGSVENAFFRADVFDRNRILLQPEYEYSGRSAKSAYYILAVDVGRKGLTKYLALLKSL